jgi:Flp pilus assembly protein TadG
MPHPMLLSSLRRFRSSESGAVAYLFAVAAIPILLTAGVVVDFSRSASLRTSLQAAVDSTALSIAKMEKAADAERVKAGKIYFDRNFDPERAETSLKVSIETDAVKVRATARVPTTFLKLAGISETEVSGYAEVPRMKDGRIELVLVLDYSYSMTENDKYVRMREAATKLVKDVSELAAPDHVKVGLVPFSGMVRVTLPQAFVRGKKGGGNWTGCTQDRRYPHNTGDTTPSPKNDATRWGELVPVQAGDKYKEPGDCDPYAKNDVNVVPLTTKLDKITQQLAKMKPILFTNITLGAQFGMHLVTPDLPFDEAASFTDERTKKFVVILTDGMQTSKGWGKNNETSIAHASANLAPVCETMRGLGVEVFTIAYDLDPKTQEGAAAHALLTSCAADDDHFYPADKVEDIAAVFDNIGAYIADAMVRLSR